MSRPRIVLLGPPASGKGTAAQRLSGMLGVPHISTGQMFREAMARGGPLGEAAGKFIDKGQLVPDEIAIPIVERWLDSTGRDGFIFDGFPRTIGQALACDEMMRARRLTLTAVILIELSEAETLRRVLGRLTCESCGALYHRAFVAPHTAGQCDRCGGKLVGRTDDTEAIARERLQWYQELTLDVVKHYEQSGALRRVNGDLGKDKVYAAVLEILET